MGFYVSAQMFFVPACRCVPLSSHLRRARVCVWLAPAGVRYRRWRNGVASGRLPDGTTSSGSSQQAAITMTAGELFRLEENEGFCDLEFMQQQQQPKEQQQQQEQAAVQAAKQQQEVRTQA